MLLIDFIEKIKKEIILSKFTKEFYFERASEIDTSYKNIDNLTEEEFDILHDRTMTNAYYERDLKVFYKVILYVKKHEIDINSTSVEGLLEKLSNDYADILETNAKARFFCDNSRMENRKLESYTALEIEWMDKLIRFWHEHEDIEDFINIVNVYNKIFTDGRFNEVKER